MNYYEHHLGDYMRDTAHLSMIEDGAYRRLIDAYYIREAPLPADSREVCRLVRAQTKQDREAVATVLREFFHATDAGWVHHRCDREIARYAEQKPAREEKRANERERQARARERRKQLYDELRAHNITAPFDATTAELVTLLSRVTSSNETPDVTPPVTPPVTRDNTATHTHLPVVNTSTTANAVVSVQTSRPSRQPRGSRKAPADLAVTDTLRAWAAEHAPAVDVDREVAKLKDHTFTSARSDWDGTVRNWLRKAQDDAAAAAARARPRLAANGHAHEPPEPAWRREQRARNVAFLGPAASAEARAAVAGYALPATPFAEAPDAAPDLLG